LETKLLLTICDKLDLSSQLKLTVTVSLVTC